MAPNSMSGTVFLGRLFWMFIGPAILFLLAVQIRLQGGGWLTGYDVAYLLVLSGLIGGRLLEFHGGNPQTATGEPATPIHFRHYVAGALLIGLVVWAVANLIGNAR